MSPRLVFLITAISDRSGVAGNEDVEKDAEPAALEKLPEAAALEKLPEVVATVLQEGPSFRLRDATTGGGRGEGNGSTAAAAGSPLLIAGGGMPRKARRSSRDRREALETARFPERVTFGAIAIQGEQRTPSPQQN